MAQMWSKIMATVILGVCLLAKRQQFSPWSRISQAGSISSGHESDTY